MCGVFCCIDVKHRLWKIDQRIELKFLRLGYEEDLREKIGFRIEVLNRTKENGMEYTFVYSFIEKVRLDRAYN